MRRRGALGSFLAVLLWATILGGVACADVEINQCAPFLDKFLVGAEWNMFYRVDNNPYFGANVGTTNKSNTSYGEALGKLRFTADKNLGWTDLEAQVGGVFMGTLGQDVYGLVDNDFDFDLDTAYLKFSKPFSTPVDLTVGTQNIQIEKWFVIGSGRGQDAALWLAYHYSFPFAVRLDSDMGPLKITAFGAQSHHYFQQWDQWAPDVHPFGKNDVGVAGVNLHLDITAEAPAVCILPSERYPRFPFEARCSNFYVYGGYYHKFDDSDLLLPNFTPAGQALLSENNTQALDFGFDTTIGGLNLSGEIVYEYGEAGRLGFQDLDRRAFGGFAMARYTFPLPFKPFIGGRYIYYSGDSNLEDSVAKDYDPMFSGFAAWSQWIIGEIVGELQLPDTNKGVAIGEVGFYPRDNIKVSLLYLEHTLDEPYYGVPYVGRLNLSSRDWAHEFNLFTDIDITKNLFLSLSVGYAIPEAAAKEVFGHDKDAVYGQAWLWVHY